MRRRLLLQFLFIIAFPSTLLFLVANSYYVRASVDQQVASRVLLLEEYTRAMETRLRFVQQMTLQFYLNAAAMAEIQDGRPILDCRQIQAEIDSYVNSNPLISSVYLYTPKGVAFSGHGVTEMDRIDRESQSRLAPLEGRVLWHFEGRLKSLFGMEQYGIYGSRHIRKDSRPIATLHVGLREAFFLDDLSTDASALRGQPLFACTAGGTVIASTDPAILPGARLFPDSAMGRILETPPPYRYDAGPGIGERLVLAVPSAASGWVLMAFISPREIARGVRGARSILSLTIPLFAIFVLSMSLVLTRRFARPLTELSATLATVGKDLRKVELDPRESREVQALRESFNTMTDRIKELMRISKEQEREKRRVSLQTLQLQLTPHFLYNSLNTIGWVAQINGQENIREITRALVSFLKEVSAVDSGFVLLGKEIELLTAYAVIQRYRYADFELAIDVPDDLRSLYVHKMMLVNLMENSIVHGFRDRAGPYWIRVRAEVKGSRLVTELSDNGCGFDPEELRRGPRASGASIGLRNTRKRIRLYHGHGYGVRVRSRPGAGCTVMITLPVLSAPCE